MAEKKVIDVLKERFPALVKEIDAHFEPTRRLMEKQARDRAYVMHCFESGLIQIKGFSDGKGNFLNGEAKAKIKEVSERLSRTSSKEDVEPEQSGQHRGRGRPRKTTTSSTVSSSEVMSLDESRSRRAAAVNADQKRQHGREISNCKKLRRPTNFDEHSRIRSVSSPPAKSRKKDKSKLSGESPESNEESDENKGDKLNLKKCEVNLQKIGTPELNKYTKSLDSVKRSSNDLFEELASDSNETNNDKRKKKMKVKNETVNATVVIDEKKSLNSRKEVLSPVKIGSEPNAQSSPIESLKSPEVFLGFGENYDKKQCRRTRSIQTPENEIVPMSIDNVRENQTTATNCTYTCDSNNIQVVKEQVEVTKHTMVRTVINSKDEENCVDIIEENLTETHSVQSKTKVLKKKDEDFDDDVFVCDEDSPLVRSRTKVIKRETDLTVQSEEEAEGSGGGRMGKKIIQKKTTNSQESENDGANARSRLKTIVKKSTNSEESEDDGENAQLKIKIVRKKTTDSQESEEDGSNARSRTKTLRKKTTDSQESEEDRSNARSRTKTLRKKTTDSHDSEEDGASSRSRTKTIRKGQKNDDLQDKYSEYLASEFKELPVVSSPATLKGDMVKKRVQDFELKLAKEEDQPARVTRAARAKASDSDHKTVQSSKLGSCSKVLLPAEKVQLPSTLSRTATITTPKTDPYITMNKFMHSAPPKPMPTPESTSVMALVTKQTAGETKLKNEERRLKRQAKEEEANLKKEKALKTQAEEARRKNEMRVKRVAAAKEAAEKEKAQLAAKLLKEKEEKFKQAEMEKQRQKEEILKKKQLQHQKTLELEERRKQQEAARLAKLKEQEEEHKRILAIKEREAETLQKQQKADLKLAEAESVKHQNAKIGKIAAINNAKTKLEQTVSSAKPQTQSYEMTPSREDRQPLPPKTETDYGLEDAKSDDSSDEESQPRKRLPLWAQGENRAMAARITSYIPSEALDLFMDSGPVMPDAQKLFEGMVVKKRNRTSSAVWRTPPMSKK